MQYLGVFDSEQAAAHAYDQAALFYKGPKAMTNFPHTEYQAAETFQLMAAVAAHVEPDSAVTGTRNTLVEEHPLLDASAPC